MFSNENAIDVVNRADVINAEKKYYQEYLATCIKTVTNEIFFDAICSNNFDTVENLLTLKIVNIDSQDHNGNTGLMWAVIKGKQNLVKLLIKYGACVDIAEKSGYTPLMRASFDGNINIVKILLEHKANINTKNKFGRTALMIASYINKNIVRLLLKAGANINEIDNKGWTALDEALDNRQIEIAILLYNAGAVINDKNNESKLDLIKSQLSCCELTA